MPYVSFVPGASGDLDFAGPVAERMPNQWKTQLWSWPGAGMEPHDPPINGYDDLVERAAAALPDGGDVIAQSMGGVVAIGIAVAHPRKVRRLVLVATSGGLDVERLGVADWRAEYRAEFANAAAWVTEQHIDHTPELPELCVPTCLIWGDSDPISPLGVGQALEATLPHANLHVIPGGTHMLARDRPEEVAELILRHLGTENT